MRLAGLNACAALFSEAREEGLVLLPETLPFLSETLSDPDAGVAAASHALLKQLEDMSGENLQEYLA